MGRKLLLIVVLLCIATLSDAQKRTTDGELSGFTATEMDSLTVWLDDSFQVQQIAGSIHYPHRTDPIANVLVEVRDDVGLIHSTRTDDDGRFHFDEIRDGRYLFKAILKGFEPVVGKVVVTKKAKLGRRVEFEMPYMP